MANRYDIMLRDNDIFISNNDFIIVQSDDQHIIDTINATAGSWKENPTDGVGILKYFKSKNSEQELSRSMKLNLQSDGYQCSPSASFDNSGNLIINPNVTI